MPSTRDIRRRIKSVKNTAQITKAMQMVASSKMRKAQLAALAGRPYATLMNTMLAHVAADSQKTCGHFGQHGQGIVRRVEFQPYARSGQVRQGHHCVHQRGQEGRAV